MTHAKGIIRRHLHIRKRVIGTEVKPRISLSRSLANMYAQLIDDLNHKTLFAVSTKSPAFKEKMKYGGNVKAASLLGEIFAQEAAKKGFSKVVFDRGGYLYHGRIKAFAESARKNGLTF
ncbi:MAG: 50S ribosomal protein L18 [Candidatus Omnitrophota bacterium]